MQIQLVADAGAALLALLAATSLGVYKPRGMTSYGRRKLAAFAAGASATAQAAFPVRGSTASTPRWVKVSGVIVIAVALLCVIMHLSGH